MRKEWQMSLLEFALCVLISTGLVNNVTAGFDMETSWPGSLTEAAGIAALISAALLLGRTRKKGRLLCVGLTLTAVLAEGTALFYSGAFSNGSFIDENPYLFAVIAISVSALVFWMTRTRAAIAVLFFFGTFLTAAFDLLKYPVSPSGYAAFFFGVQVFFLVRVHSTARSPFKRREPSVAASSEERPTEMHLGIKSRLLQPIAIALFVIILSSAFYFGIVKPLDLPVDEMKLAKRLMSMEVMEKLGIATKTIIYTDQPTVPDDQRMNQKQDELKNKEQKQEPESRKENGRIGTGSKLAAAVAITYQKAVHRMWIAAPLLLLFAAMVFSIQFYRKKHWYRELLKKSREEAALTLYLYFLKQLKKAGHKRAADLTLLEYTRASDEFLCSLSVYDADFLKLTQIYQRILYGCQRISEQELDLFLDFYQELSKNLRKKTGSKTGSLKQPAFSEDAAGVNSH